MSGALLLASSTATFPSAAFAAAGGFLRFEAANPGNGATAVLQNFNPSDVDTGNGRISLPDLGFGAFGSYPGAKATRVWFTSTGTLPSPLVAGNGTNNFYYRTDLGGGLARFYKAASDSDYAVLPGAIQGEKVRPAQRYAQDVDHVIFTTQGTGVHTCNTWPITNTLTNMGTSAYTASTNSTADRNTWFEIENDANGRPCIWSEKFSADPTLASYRGYGKTFPLGPGALRLQLKGEVGQKRYIWQLAIVQPFVEKEQTYPKISPAAGAVVDTVNDKITFTTPPFATTDKVQFLAWPGSTIPGGVSVGTDYFARVATNDITFHPTSTDATNNTNKIDLTSAGGDFSVFATQRIGDGIRWRFTIEMIEPGVAGGGGGNALSPRGDQEANKLNFSVFSSSGGTAGEITGSNETFPDGTKVYLFMPVGAVGPTCTDNSSALTAGNYWTSTVSTKLRLHRTQQSAMQSIGQATNVSDCIKFNVAGAGECQIMYDDGSIYTTFGAERPNTLPAFVNRVPATKAIVLSHGVDFNNSGASGLLMYQGVDTNLDETLDVAGSKGLTDTASITNPASASPGTLLNSGASHVAFYGRMYAFLCFAGTTAPSLSDILSVVNYYKSFLGITSPAPTNTVAATVSDTPGVGDLQTAQMGTWTGDPTITYSFQWQRADDRIATNLADIGSATSLNYTPVSGDQGKFLRLKTTATNRGGATVAFSAFSLAAAVVSGEAETAALIARWNNQPSAPHRALIKTAITKMKTDNVWGKLDGLYVWAVDSAQGSQEAILNWTASNGGTITGGVTFTPKIGVAGNGTTGYIDTGINPSTAGGHYTQNSATMFLRILTNVAASTNAMAIAAATTRAKMSPRSAGGTFATSLNTTVSAYSVASSDSRGYRFVTRNSSTTIDVRFDKTSSVAGFSQTSAGMSNGNIRFMNDTTGAFYAAQLAYGGFGGGMTATDSDNLYDALEAYISGVAAL